MKRIIIFMCALMALIIIMPCTIAVCAGVVSERQQNQGKNNFVLSSDRLGTYGKLMIDFTAKSESSQKEIILQGGSLPDVPENSKNNIEIGDWVSNKKDVVIKVFFHEKNIVKDVKLEDYIAGVVLGEMYLSFEEEALKAQAVAARSYTMYMIKQGSSSAHKDGAVICTDYTHCQTWKDPMEIYSAYPKEQAEVYYKKLTKVVNETCGKVLVHNGEIVKAYYFGNSGGFTESYDSVWGGENLDYTQTVPCVGEADKDNFCTLDYFTPEDFLERFKKADGKVNATPENIFSTINIISRTSSNRIDEMSVGGVVFKGTEVRSILGLKSTNIVFRQLDDGRILTVTFGSGHGVGMSQWGAQAMAENGSNYEEILKYYYKDVEIVDLAELQ